MESVSGHHEEWFSKHLQTPVLKPCVGLMWLPFALWSPACVFAQTTECLGLIFLLLLLSSFPGWLDSLLRDQRWAHVRGPSCLTVSLRENNWLHRRVVSDPELHRVGPQRAVPACHQHARVCQEEETHQTGTQGCEHTRAQGEESSHASRSVLFLVWEADVTEPLDWPPDPVQQEALALTLLRGNYQGLCCFLIYRLRRACSSHNFRPEVVSTSLTSLCSNRGRCWEATCWPRKKTAERRPRRPAAPLRTRNEEEAAALERWVIHMVASWCEPVVSKWKHQNKFNSGLLVGNRVIAAHVWKGCWCTCMQKY